MYGRARPSTLEGASGQTVVPPEDAPGHAQGQPRASGRHSEHSRERTRTPKEHLTVTKTSQVSPKGNQVLPTIASVVGTVRKTNGFQ